MATMSDEQWDSNKVRIQIGQDLTSIAEMYVKLKSEAINRAGDPSIPGGAAMVLLGPGADVEAWGYVQMSAMFGRLKLSDADRDLIERNGIEPPLSFLASWSDIVREDRGGTPTERRARLADEIRYLRESLDWMLSTNDEGEPWWLPVEDFSNRLHQVRTTLENVLSEGVRLDRIRARCMYCDQAPRLARRYVDGAHNDDSRDHWYCPNRQCAHVYDAGGVQRCHEHRLRAHGERDAWVPLTDAAKNLGRSIRTLRTWANPPVPYEVILKTRRSPRSGRIEVRWSEALTAADTKAKRNRDAERHSRVLSSA